MTDALEALTRGTLWSAILRWFIKGIGLVSTVVLARFLTPADYGVMVMAMLTIGLVEIFFSTSADTALLRDPDSSDALANSAWSLRLIQAMLVAVVVAALSPLAASFYSEPRVIPVMIVLAIGMVLSALANIGPVLARKNLDFGLEVRIGILSKLVSFFVSVLAAYLLRSYWALVIGACAGQLADIYFSYRYHPFRPRWDLSRIRALWGFSQWLLAGGIASFFSKKSDELILGRIGDATSLGSYNVASEIGQTVTVEISAPVNRSLFPVLSSMQGNREGSLSLFFSTLGSINTVTIPLGIGMCILAAPITQVLLGSAWLSVIPILEVFAVQGVIRFLVSPYYVWFMVTGRTKLLAVVSWLELSVFLLFAALLYSHGAIGLAWSRLLTTLVIVLLWVVLGAGANLSPAALVRSLMRPLASGMLMAISILQLRSVLTSGNPYLEVLVFSISGALIYAIVLVSLWALMGRPDGLEKWVLKRMRIFA
jgi:lipopolysaccharide exporter